MSHHSIPAWPSLQALGGTSTLFHPQFVAALPAGARRGRLSLAPTLLDTQPSNPLSQGALPAAQSVLDPPVSVKSKHAPFAPWTDECASPLPLLLHSAVFYTDWKSPIKQYKHICQDCSQWLGFSEEMMEKEQCLIPRSVGFAVLCYLSFVSSTFPSLLFFFSGWKIPQAKIFLPSLHSFLTQTTTTNQPTW